MRKQSREAPQSIFDSALCHHPCRQLLLSSTPASGPNLLAQQYHYTAAHTHLRMPALMEDTILIPLYGAAHLSGMVAQPFPPQHVQPGNIFIIPHHLPTEWQWTAAWDALHLYLAPPLLANVAADTLGIDTLEVNLNVRIGIPDALIHQLGLALMAELQANGLASSHYVAALIQTLTLHLLRSHALFSRDLPTRAAGLTPHSLRRVLDYIHSHLAQPLTQVEVAAIVNVSPFHFARLFRQATGQSLHQYIITQRIAAAERLLLAGGLTLTEIALRVGFTDQSHLARHFKRQCGMTPKLFAKARTNVQQDRMNLQEVER